MNRMFKLKFYIDEKTPNIALTFKAMFIIRYARNVIMHFFFFSLHLSISKLGENDKKLPIKIHKSTFNDKKVMKVYNFS